MIRSAKQHNYLSEFEKHSGNAKETWASLQTLLNRKQATDNIPTTLRNLNGELVTGDVNVAEIFNTFFTEVGVNLHKNLPSSSFDPISILPCIDDEMELEPTDEEELTTIINSLKNVGAGADNINSKLFKGTVPP